jgi:hypothetical protein
MKKINTILAAVGALLMLSVTSANSIEFKTGISANGMAAYANARETLKGNGTAATGMTGRTTDAEAILATSFTSLFAEVGSEELMGLGIGVSYAPEVVDLNKETRHIGNCKDSVAFAPGVCTAETSVAGIDADGGAQVVDGKIDDLVTVYLTLPIGDTGAYVKAGYMMATLTTEEQLASGSKYENIDMEGTTIGGGYEGSLGDMAFWRAEGSYQMWDDIDARGSEANNSGASDNSTNRVQAELGSVTGTLSVGMKF